MSRSQDEMSDTFYAAWADDLVQRSVDSLAAELHGEGKGDHLRVLYGRLCEGLTIAQVSEALGISNAAVDRYFRQARARLGRSLKNLLRGQVHRYCPPEEAADECAAEWSQLGQYLKTHGGIEEAVSRAFAILDPVHLEKHSREASTRALSRLTALMSRSSTTSSNGGSS
jgi:hypothetical protein